MLKGKVVRGVVRQQRCGGVRWGNNRQGMAVTAGSGSALIGSERNGR